MKVHVDLTEFVTSPHRTGIQRVTAEVCLRWPDPSQLVPVLVTSEESMVALPERVLSLMREYFECSGSGDSLANSIRETALQSKSNRQIESSEMERLLVPEVFYDPMRVRHYERFDIGRLQSTYFIVYDLLPLTHPEFFVPDVPHEILGRYYRLIRKMPNVAFMSEATSDAYHRRLRRNSSPASTPLVGGGSDGLGPKPDVPVDVAQPHFVVLGTIEPRKSHNLILDAIEPLFGRLPELRLTFLGRMGWVKPDVERRIRTLAENCPSFQWVQGADDEAIRTAVLHSRCALFITPAEGYGLPPVECLWLGTPVIASPDVPSLSEVGDRGVRIIPSIDPLLLREAVLDFTNDDYYRTKAREARRLSLPTWGDFARKVATWVSAGDSEVRV